MRAVADQHFARPSSLLQARRNVHRIAGHERSAAVATTRHDHAAVYADAELDAEAALGRKLLIQAGDLVAQLNGGAHRAQRVIFVKQRNAEDRHDGVADELLDRATVALQDRSGGREVARQGATHRFRIELLAEGR
jgi:hypothetical protein